MRRANFQLENIEECTFSGYIDERTWNGWAVPYFPYEEAQAIVEVLAPYAPSHYDESSGEFVFEDEDREEERFGPVEMDGMKLYGIGAGSWMWEEIALL